MDCLPNDVLLLVAHSLIQKVESFRQLLHLRCVSRRFGYIIQYYLDVLSKDPVGWVLSHECKPIIQKWIKDLSLSSPISTSSYSKTNKCRFVQRLTSHCSKEEHPSRHFVECILSYVYIHSSSKSFLLWVWDQLYQYTSLPLRFKLPPSVSPAQEKLSPSFLFQNNSASHISFYIEQLRCYG
jgi:hypothetical protein